MDRAIYCGELTVPGTYFTFAATASHEIIYKCNIDLLQGAAGFDSLTTSEGCSTKGWERFSSRLEE